jgi:hypothetical protein
MLRKSLCSTFLAGALLWAGMVATAQAITFTYDCVSGTCAGGVGGVVPNSTKATDIADIQNYMNGVFAAAGVVNSVTLNKGTKSLLATPDGHPNASTYPYLGNTDGATNPAVKLPLSLHPVKDTYLINDWKNGSLAAGDMKDRIIMTFAQPIFSVAFDWEIFPQTNVPSDISVLADGKLIFFEELLACTISPCTNPAVSLNVQTGDLGHFNTYDFNTSNPLWAALGGGNGGVTVLQFVDWSTAPIGIDNLEVGQVPEPTSLLLLGSGLAGLAVWGRRKNPKD